MHSCVRTRSGAVLVAALAVAWLALAGLASAGSRPAVAKGSKATPAPAVQDPQGYAGEETCLTCHEAQTKGYHGSPHGQKWNAKSPAATRGCESCHGPGKAHADAGGDKTKISTFKTMTASQASATCTNCHNKGSHMMWEGSAHDNRNVGCVTCHSVHSPKSAKAQLKTVGEAETCVQCHRDKVQKMSRSAHMPVREGKMECTSCHNPHGTTNLKLLKAGISVNEACTTCHAEKRGPFLWEHAPVVENCTTCHDAHGSSNDRMLVAKQPFICQRCHVTARHPPTIYDGFVARNSTSANKVYGRSCVLCHQQVHGSNAPSGKAFLR